MRSRRTGGLTRRSAATLAALLLVVAAGAAVVPTLLLEDREEFRWEATWGGAGSGPGAFRGPVGIAVDGSGFVYVSDSGNNRIQKLTREGRFVDAWSGAGTARGELRRPMHLELVGDSLLYVAEYLSDRVRVFGLDGTPVAVVAEDTVAAGGALDAPGGVARGPETGDELWIADFFNHRVAVYRRGAGFVRRVGRSGRWLHGRLHYPTDVAFGPDGTAYVADAYNHRIQRYAPDGVRLDTWGGPLGLGVPGPWKGWFRVATGVHADRRGRVYVADFYNDRIQVFGPSGGFVAEWGGSGSGPGAFDRPTDVDTGSDGRLYVADFGNDRVQVFVCSTCEDG